MRTVMFILQKEFLQIFRNKGMLPIIILLPVVQLVLLGYAANYEIKNIAIDVVDQDHSTWSNRLTDKIAASAYFQLNGSPLRTAAALEDLENNQADLVLVIPAHFERDLVRNDRQKLQIMVNAITGRKAGIAAGYIQNIIRDFNRQLSVEWTGQAAGESIPTIEVTNAFWYNPHMDYKQFMVPGILVILVTMIGAFLSGMNIVREKEMGTMEQLNVTPIRKLHFIIGKLLPFWLIALAELALGLVLAWWLFDLVFTGSVWLVFLFAAVYLLVMLGLGLLISTRTQTQQQAMFITWFFFVIFLLLSGLFTPISSMPVWAQHLTWFNPVGWFIKVIRMVLLKGSGWPEIRFSFAVICGFALIVNTVAVLAYKKQA